MFQFGIFSNLCIKIKDKTHWYSTKVILACLKQKKVIFFWAWVTLNVFQNLTKFNIQNVPVVVRT